jgi:hypothetical protein
MVINIVLPAVLGLILIGESGVETYNLEVNWLFSSSVGGLGCTGWVAVSNQVILTLTFGEAADTTYQ